MYETTHKCENNKLSPLNNVPNTFLFVNLSVIFFVVNFVVQFVQLTEIYENYKRIVNCRHIHLKWVVVLSLPSL